MRTREAKVQSNIEKVEGKVERLLQEPGEKLEQLFGEDLERSAREQKAFLRRREIQTAKDLLHVALVYALKDWSLNMLGAWAIMAGIGYLSDVALIKRLRNCADWLGHLLFTCLQKQVAVSSADAGLKICLRDATVVNSPQSKGTEWRIHLKLNLAKRTIEDVAVTDNKTGEGLAKLDIQADEIHVGDRGYCLVSGIGAVLAKFAHVVVRLNHQNLPLWRDAHTRFDLYAWLRSLNAPAEHPVQINTPFGWFAMRVLASPLAPEKAEEARRQVRENARKKKYTPSEKSLLAAGFFLLITDLSVSLWPMKRVFWLYRMRWQVELQFKTYKSLLQLDHLRSHEPKLARTYLLAKLLLVLLIDQLSGTVHSQQPDWFSDPQRPISPWQLTRLFKEYLEQILVPASTFTNFWLVLSSLQRYFCVAPRRRLDQLAWARAFLEHFSVSTNFCSLS